MRIKGLERERKQRKRRDAMRVDNAGVRRIQLALIQRRTTFSQPSLAARHCAPSPSTAGEGKGEGLNP